MSSPPPLDLLEEIARSNDQTEGFTPRLIQCRANALADHIEPGTVLDLGCADGILTRKLAERHRRVVAVDASALRIERTRKWCAGLGVQVVQSYFEQFEPPGGERYDAIVMSCVLEHLDDPVAQLARCRDWLAPGGSVISIVPHARSVHRRAGVHLGMLESLEALGEADDALDHKRAYTLDTLRREYEQAGLRVNAQGGILFKPLPNSRMSELPPALIDAYEALGRQLPDLAAEIYTVGRP